MHRPHNIIEQTNAKILASALMPSVMWLYNGQ